eukprot:NODE_4248_length_484_cov_25.491954_g3643_i0.p3 GENE.NODE_4248_length_484_cov_25.491954_g3643_i0~~NODE_4248_length_484_cov_25.491954_g3643_i0.p3  ORF type:complete len:98 (+),score=15.06 NODE_4248_length_484_cov_25.491954_g3643_i0:120-413(+)
MMCGVPCVVRVRARVCVRARVRVRVRVHVRVYTCGHKFVSDEPSVPACYPPTHISVVFPCGGGRVCASPFLADVPAIVRWSGHREEEMQIRTHMYIC